MSLKNLKLKHTYSSENDNLLEDFYLPVLSEAVTYKRVAGYFSSSSFAFAAVGLAKMIEKGGHLQFLININLSKKDYDAINKGVQRPQEIIENLMIEDIKEFTDECVHNQTKVLGWLIANKFLDIKVGYIEDQITGNDILHQKVGIMTDSNGNIISFSGSNNESASGWTCNSEKFKVFFGWEKGNQIFIQDDIDDFDKLWLNKSKKTKVIDFPSAVKKELIRISPKSRADAIALSNLATKELLKRQYDQIIAHKKEKKQIKLRYYQNDAITNWFDKGKSGIFAMATATGKTFTALACVDRLIKEEKVGIIIVTPQNTLTQQWIKDNLKSFNLKGFEVFGTNKKVLDSLANAILDINSNEINYFIAGTTYDTFSKDKFIDVVKKSEVPLLLIADEVHSVASPERKKGLIPRYDYRLGLSATPTRYMDGEGTKIIYDFFYKSKFDAKKGDTYTFDIKRAINEVNPDTNETYLTPYEYYPFICELTSNEYIDYIDLSKKISRAYYIAKEKDDYDTYNRLLNIRKDIIKNAFNKISTSKNILMAIPKIQNSLFFLDTENQIQDLKNMINEQFPFVTYKTFTTKSFGGNKDSKYGMLKDFSKGEYDMLLSINCFTEGIDVPSVEVGIFLASSTNPKEFIQRRGRVLRRFPGKEKAIIYDIIVSPGIKKEKMNKEDLNIAKSLLIPELKRYKVFAEDSSNYTDNYKIVLRLLEKYGIDYKRDL